MNAGSPTSQPEAQPEAQPLGSLHQSTTSALVVTDPPNSPLNRIPLDIGHHRQLLFDLVTPVQFDQNAWDRYWPFIDNVWCLHNKADVSAHLPTTGKTEKFWGGCRLQRQWKQQDRDPTNSGGRKRNRRQPGQCPAKFRVVLEPNGIRTLERSKEAHSHDLDYIDSIKRCSGVRALVADPFFAGWESGSILAYLKDPANAPPSLPFLLDQAGGKYLERREIINIFSQKLRTAYPGLDQTTLKKQKEKYEGVKTCNVKGCNRSFKDAKELARHKKDEHEQKKHDHSDKMFTCPRKDCHRHKRSKGFATKVALREHMLRMKHWGLAGYHATDGMRLVEVITESERAAVERGEDVEAEPLGRSPLSNDSMEMQHTLQSSPLPFLPPSASTDDTAPLENLSGHDDGLMQLASTSSPIHDLQHRQAMMQRLQVLEMERARMEQEMERLRTALFAG
ncbi:uncharacterized protein PV09_06684, partial [Verruconis gallopava]